MERRWITVRDGTRLAADLYLPKTMPAPVVIEALPYRKDDLTVSSHEDDYQRLCSEGGFVVCRLDVRGTGSSEGRATDEYPAVELDDLADVIAFLAVEPFSNGNVGMFGYSYSGFNSLQLACERPPALKAICAIYATDDRYTDDVHYMGGSLRAIDLVDYNHYMTAMNALPPVPALWGQGWRDEWLARINEHEPWFLIWLREQLDGPYWRHGSVRPGYDRIECATMLVGGWADGYRNNSFRTFAALECEKSLLMGPWSHMGTMTSLPGPHIDLVTEMNAWFGKHLRGDDVEIDPIRLFVRHATKPEPDLEFVHGQWRIEHDWPTGREVPLVLADHRPRTLAMRADVGTAAWISCAGSLPWGQSLDQRADDAWSLVSDWPVVEPIEVLGHVRARVRLAVDQPVASLSVKLCNVWPDGTSAMVTRGFLNLTHRTDPPTPMEPGEFVEVEVELEAASWVFPVGHQLRISIAGVDWPNTWAPPGLVMLDVQSVEIELPTVTEGGGGLPHFAPVPAPTRTPTDTTWRIDHDVLRRTTRAITQYGSTWDHRDDGQMTDFYAGEVGVSLTDPADSWATGTTRFEVDWPGVEVAVEARLQMRSDAETYHVTIELDAIENGELIAKRHWHADIPRHLA